MIVDFIHSICKVGRSSSDDWEADVTIDQKVNHLFILIADWLIIILTHVVYAHAPLPPGISAQPGEAGV
jgi:hypothetical protein